MAHTQCHDISNTSDSDGDNLTRQNRAPGTTCQFSLSDGNRTLALQLVATYFPRLALVYLLRYTSFATIRFILFVKIFGAKTNKFLKKTMLLQLILRTFVDRCKLAKSVNILDRNNKDNDKVFVVSSDLSRL